MTEETPLQFHSHKSPKKEVAMTDERIRRDSAADTSARQPRAMESRDRTEDRQNSDDEAMKSFIAGLDAEVLPTLPKIPGYHVVWLSMTHQTDSIHRRQKMGYQPIKPEDLPKEFEHLTGPKGTKVEGLISCNEMVGYKSPERLYRAIMTHFHHTRPIETEEQIRMTLESAVEQEAVETELGEGFRNLGLAPKQAPVWDA